VVDAGFARLDEQFTLGGKSKLPALASQLGNYPEVQAAFPEEIADSPLDTRLHTKPYGGAIYAALPTTPLTSDVKDVRSLFL
jgi:hypothetical protein